MLPLAGELQNAAEFLLHLRTQCQVATYSAPKINYIGGYISCP